MLDGIASALARADRSRIALCAAALTTALCVAADASAAAASPPTVLTEGATSLQAGEEQLHGSVNPNGTVGVACFVQYGTTTAYGNVAACEQTPQGTQPVPVSARLAGLAAGAVYHFNFEATYGEEPPVFGGDRSFETAPSATTYTPSVFETYTGTEPVANAMLDGYVAVAGATVTSCRFEYGTSPSLGSSLPCTQSVGASSAFVSATISGLQWSTTYYVRLSASDSATSYGATDTFTTPDRAAYLPYTPPPQQSQTTPTPYVPYTPPAYTGKPYSHARTGSGPASDRGLSVYYCPYGRTSRVAPTAHAASTSEAGWPAKECLKMDKGPAGRRHTIVGMRHVHNWLLGGWGNDTIVGGEKGDVIWADYQECCWPKHQTAYIHAGNGRNVIYANDTLDYVWTGTNPKTVVHAHASGISGVIHCQNPKIVLFLSTVSERHFTLDGCHRISHYSVGY